MYECLYCGKTSFKTERGLDQHLARSSYCRGQHEVDDGDMTGYYTAEEGMAYTTIVNQAKTKRSKHGNPPSEPKTSLKTGQSNLQIQKFLSSQPASKTQQGTDDVAWTQPLSRERDNLFQYPNEEYATDYEEYNTALEDNGSEDDEQFFGMGNNENETNEEVSANGENLPDMVGQVLRKKSSTNCSKKSLQPVQLTNVLPWSNGEWRIFGNLWVSLLQLKRSGNARKSVSQQRLYSPKWNQLSSLRRCNSLTR